MDVKTNAELVNSIASGESIECPQCGRVNKAGGKFCVACGTKLPAPVVEEVKAVEEVKTAVEEVNVIEEVKEEPKAGTAFAPIDEKTAEAEEKPIEAAPEKPQSAPAFASVDATPAAAAVVEEKKPEPVKVVSDPVYEEPESVFAQGLPEWSIEPPQVVVRRKR